MKIIILAASFAAMAGFASCDSCSTGRQEKTTATDTHNARNSLDYEGVYEGYVVWGGEKEEVKVSVTLDGDKYTRTISEAAGGKTLSIQKGTYVWNEEGNTVMLQRADRPNTYFVGEGRLIQMDKQGDNATNGKYAEKRSLNKKR